MEERDTGPGAGTGEGPVILVVGILGLFMQALGPVAWIWGNQALKRAKPNEAGLIQAGRILGIIDTVILVLVVILFVGYYIFWISIMGPMNRSMDREINTAVSSMPSPTAPAPRAHKPAHATKPLPAKAPD
jgi:hypothetical protein